jgi:hypothetical protein
VSLLQFHMIAYKFLKLQQEFLFIILIICIIITIGGLGVALPAGTPRGSDDGCAGQGGVAGFSSETAGGGGAEKMVRRGGILRRSWSSGGRGGCRRGPAAGGWDGGGEARSKRGG